MVALVVGVEVPVSAGATEDCTSQGSSSNPSIF